MIGGEISLGSAMRLDVDIGDVEELLRPFHSDILNRIDVHASAIIPVARIAFGVFSHENGGGGVPHIDGWIVFRRDKLYAFVLPFFFCLEEGFHFFVRNHKHHYKGWRENKNALVGREKARREASRCLFSGGHLATGIKLEIFAFLLKQFLMVAALDD